MPVKSCGLVVHARERLKEHSGGWLTRVVSGGGEGPVARAVLSRLADALSYDAIGRCSGLLGRGSGLMFVMFLWVVPGPWNKPQVTSANRGGRRAEVALCVHI